jgi:hypothetical protein
MTDTPGRSLTVKGGRVGRERYGERKVVMYEPIKVQRKSSIISYYDFCGRQ